MIEPPDTGNSTDTPSRRYGGMASKHPRSPPAMVPWNSLSEIAPFGVSAEQSSMYCEGSSSGYITHAIDRGLSRNSRDRHSAKSMACIPAARTTAGEPPIKKVGMRFNIWLREI